MNTTLSNFIKSSVFAILLSSCATTSKVINGPDGTPHQLVSCNSIEYCYEKASEVCGGTYKIINTSNEISGDVQLASTVTHLLIKCKN